MPDVENGTTPLLRVLPEDRVLYAAVDVRPGDLIAYPGRVRSQAQRTVKDWLRVVVVEQNGNVRGKREVPDDWEREVEFTVFERQIRDNGIVRRRA